MPELWAGSGYRHLDRAPDGRLTVTDDYLRTYLHRPELAPVPESCEVERSLHHKLLEEPRRPVSDDEIERISDDDARENYRIVLRFRDKLLKADSVEAFYFDLFRHDIAVPPPFIHHTAQVILRGLLGNVENGLDARAAELFFRPQSVSIDQGAVMVADQETVHNHATTAGLGEVGRFLRELQAPLKSAELDVLDEANHLEYFARDQRHDLVLDMTPGRPGAAAFARVLQRWIAHFHGVNVKIESIREIPDEEWVWHVGLDAEATTMLNDIYNGAEVDEATMKRVIGLFRMEFVDVAAMLPELRGAPVFLALAMTPEGTLRMKPQNLLMNLPLARPT